MGDASRHAKLAPSAAARWVRCPAAPAMSQGYPNESSELAAEGTAAHHLAALCLLEGTQAAERVGRSVEGFKVTPDMAQHVQRYVDAVRRNAEGCELWIEERVDASRIAPGVYGTADAVVVDSLAGELHVHDLKFGRGVVVHAEGNEQLRTYAVGALDLADLAGADIDTIVTHIHQPRRAHYSTETLTVQELNAWAEQEAAPAADQATRLLSVDDRGELARWCAPGEDQCRWCLAASDCRPRAEWMQDIVAGELFGEDTQPGPDPATMDAGDIARIYPHLSAVESWVKDIRKRAMALAQAGNPPPGYKLVEGRLGNRRWTDPKAVEDLMRDRFRLKRADMYDQKLISPTKALETLSKRRVNKLRDMIERPPGSPLLVPVSDPRPELDNTATAEDFK